MPPTVPAVPAAINPAPVVAPEPRAFPTIPIVAPSPFRPVPFAAEPMIVLPRLPASDVPVAASLPNIALPTLKVPFPRLASGPAIFASITAEKIEDKSADFPPGSNFPALFTMLPNPWNNLLVIASESNPSANPFANEAPTLAPSFNVSDTSTPRSVSIPSFNPVPILVPISPAMSAIFCFPVLFHHSLNGSAIKSSQAIFTLPKKSAFCHSSLCVISLNFRFIRSTLVSTQSIISLSPCSIFGIWSVNQSAIPLTYGDNRSPNEIFTPSIADCNNVIEPSKLSSIVSDILDAAPSALFMESASLL